MLIDILQRIERLGDTSAFAEWERQHWDNAVDPKEKCEKCAWNSALILAGDLADEFYRQAESDGAKQAFAQMVLALNKLTVRMDEGA